MRIFPVNRKFSTLTECLRTIVDTANKGFLAGVSILVLLQVLRERERLLTVIANVLLRVYVTQIVTFKRELAREELLALADIAFVNFFPHLLAAIYYY